MHVCREIAKVLTVFYCNSGGMYVHWRASAYCFDISRKNLIKISFISAPSEEFFD